jgi:hypothetical protein
MKYYLLIPILAIFILAGCAKENSIIGPQSSQIQSKSQWITISHSPSLSVENIYSVSKSINGNNGGSIELTQAFINDGQQASVTATLTIPQGAFNGNKVISFTVNTETAEIDFTSVTPKDKDFDQSLSLDLTFSGINISEYKVSDLGFSYFDGSNIVPIKSAYENVDINQGLLIVLGAQINHFSRYGWSTKDDPLN